MLYRKNLYRWEQVLRLGGSIGLIAYAAAAMWGNLLGYALIATGVVLGVTGLFGFCPMCAMFGKTVKTTTTR